MKPPKLVLVIPSLLLLAVSAASEVVERVIAKVNGDIITQSEFQARQLAAVQAARVGPAGVDKFLRENNARILQEAIDELLIVQRGRDMGISRLRPEYLHDVVEGIKKENNIQTDEELQEQLRREGMSLDDLKRNIERSILRRQVLSRELDSKAGITEADARADYEARQAEYTRLPSVHLQEILIPAEKENAKDLAEEVVRRARSGEDFAELARQHSAAPSRASGGDLGRLTRGDMDAAVEKAAFSLEPGAVLDPLPTPAGYRILRVTEKTEGSEVPFEEVKGEITQKLAQQRMSREYEEYLEELRKTAVIDIKVREVPLQLEVPVTPGTRLETPDAKDLPGPGEKVLPEGAVIPESTPEITTTPQQKPERVAPPPVPDTAGKKPGPAPAPTPTPQPPEGRR